MRKKIGMWGKDLCAIAASFALAGVASAQWPEFRGPGAQGHSTAARLPLKWSETENIAWRRPIEGVGWSSPVVEDGTIWITTAVDEGRSLRAVAVDVETGAVKYDVEVFHFAKPPAKHAKNSYASPTPVLHGGRVYVHFGTMGTAALEAATGKILWKNTEFKLDHEVGPGSSPVVFENMLILTCDGTDVQFMAALNLDTGGVIWNKPRPDVSWKGPEQRKAFCTPLLIEVGGQKQLISPGAQRVIAYDPANGAELWQFNYDGFSNVPRPVTAAGLVYICTGFGPTRMVALRPESKGVVGQEAVAWEIDKQTPQNPSPVVVGDEIYMVSDKGIATCMDTRTGKVHWKERLGGNFSSSMTYGAGRIYVSSEEGVTFVFEPGKTYKPLAENQLDSQIMASPAMLEGAIILRTDKEILRVEEP